MGRGDDGSAAGRRPCYLAKDAPACQPGAAGCSALTAPRCPAVTPLGRPGDRRSARRRAVAAGQIALAQALHFVASTALSVLQNGQSFAGAAASSLMNVRAIRNTTNATMTKVMIVLMKAP